jgi:hypothetical protein
MKEVEEVWEEVCKLANQSQLSNTLYYKQNVMPARQERIYLYSRASDQPNKVVDFPLWWDRREFLQKYQDRQVEEFHPVYVNYAMLLTVGEAMAWDQQCREKFSTNPNSMKSHMVIAMARFKVDLKTTKWVIVESYEWESGLD